MGKWISIVRCRECGACYDYVLPKHCEKCSTQITFNNGLALVEFKELIRLTENAEFTIGKKGLFKWKIK